MLCQEKCGQFLLGSCQAGFRTQLPVFNLTSVAAQEPDFLMLTDNYEQADSHGWQDR